MFQEIYYLNHLNEKIDMVSDCYSIADVPFASHTWDFETEDSSGVERIKKKKKKLQKQSFSMRVANAGLMSHDDAYNKLINAFETDILAESPGKLCVDNQYLECYIYEMSADVIVDGLGSSIHSFKIIASHPFWIQKLTKQFYPQTEPYALSGLNFETDFPFDFASNDAGTALWNIEHYASSHFEMIVYGPCVNPRVLINGYPYQIFTQLESNDYLILNSRNHTVTKYLANGTTANIYNSRQFTPSVFEKIPGGQLTFNWIGDFGFDLVLYVERSEPKW